VKARDELFAEVYDELCEEYQDWQAANPEGDEQTFLDARREHPMRYAARLAGDGGHYLIGPELYFSFISALKVGAGITAGVFLLLAVITALASGAYWGSFLRMLLAYPQALLWVAAAILGVFIAMQHSGERASWLDRWQAKDLKPLDGHQGLSRADAYGDLGISTLLLLWITGLLSFPSMIRHDSLVIEGWTFNLPGWFLWGIAALLVFDIAFAIVRLRHSFWSAQLRWVTIIGNVVWIAALAWAASHGPMLALPEPLASEVPDVAMLVNRVLAGILWVVCAILTWEAAWHLWQLLDPRRDRLVSAEPPLTGT
jgi:hypothetical protein